MFNKIFPQVLGIGIIMGPLISFLESIAIAKAFGKFIYIVLFFQLNVVVITMTLLQHDRMAMKLNQVKNWWQLVSGRDI